MLLILQTKVSPKYTNFFAFITIFAMVVITCGDPYAKIQNMMLTGKNICIMQIQKKIVAFVKLLNLYFVNFYKKAKIHQIDH